MYRGNTHLRSFTLNLQTMLVTAGQKKDVFALGTMITGHGIGDSRTVSMTDMQFIAGIIDRGGLVNLPQWTVEQLRQVRGIGKVKAIQIRCLAELARRMAKAEALEGLDFSSPNTIARYYMEDMRHRQKEVMKLLLLNTKAKLIGASDISVGTVNATLVSPRELFLEALKKNAVSIILLHNHPSGDPTPSQEDILLTQRVRKAGDLIGIELLDHIIIGDNRYISLREKGFFCGNPG